MLEAMVRLSKKTDLHVRLQPADLHRKGPKYPGDIFTINLRLPMHWFESLVQFRKSYRLVG